jgi:hypothetical protein
MPSSAVLLGSQRPRLESRPDAVASHGEKVCAFAALAGVNLDDWQQYVMWGLFDVDAANEWAATEFGLLVSRQNGKGEVLVAYDLAHLFLFPRTDGRRKTILHTAHEMKTAVDGFQRLAGVIQSSPRLLARVHRIYTANGQEGIVLKPRPGQQMGDRIRFIARSKNSGRGFSGDVMVYDEAQQLPSFSRDALTYTQTAIPNRQELYTGTVPSDLDDSEAFEGVRDRGRAGNDARTGWMEWSPAGSEDPAIAATLDLTDRQVWADSIPALGIRIKPETVEAQVGRATDVASLARERFSIWPTAAEQVDEPLNEIDLKQYDANVVDAGTLGVGAVIAVALGKGGQFTTVAAAARQDDDTIFFEHKKTERGTLWAAAYLKELKAELGNALLVIDAKNAAALITDLDREGIKHLSMSLDEIAGAYNTFVELSNDGLSTHRAQAEVRRSIEYATTRAIGRAGVTWDASDPTKPIAHTQAVTWAVWGVKKQEANPRRDVPPPPPQAELLRRDDAARDDVNLRTAAF